MHAFEDPPLLPPRCVLCMYTLYGQPVTLLSVFLSLYLLVSTSETQGLLTVWCILQLSIRHNAMAQMLDPKSSLSVRLLESALVNCLLGSSFIQLLFSLSAPMEDKEDLGNAYPQFLPNQGSSG